MGGAVDTSKAMCLAGLFKAFQLATPHTEQWVTSNDQQRSFLETYQGVVGDLPQLERYLKGIVTADASELEAWFIANGFPEMNVSIPSGGAGIGIIFDLLVKWVETGERTISKIGQEVFEVVQMTSNPHLHSWALVGHPYPMFEISTKEDGWKVFLVEVDGQHNPIDLPSLATKFLKLERRQEYVDIFCFPAASLSLDVDVSFLVGLHLGDFRVDEAIKKVKLSINSVGATARCAVALGGKSATFQYMIKSPYIVAFWKEGLNFPGFVALCDRDSWIRA